MADPSDNQPQQEVVASLRNYQQPSIAGNVNQGAAPVASPVQPQAMAAAVPQTTGAVYEEIQIAPHPTTNRFPWNPVQNPVVEITSTPQPDPVPETEPVFEIPEPAVVQQPAQTFPPVPQDPPPQPQPQPEPAPVPIEPPAAELVPVVPVAPVTPEPAPLAFEPPVSIAEPVQPVATPEPIVVPQPVEPPNVVEQLPPQPEPAPLPIEPPAPEPVPAGSPMPVHPPAAKPIHIYSQYTREVWSVFKPNNIIRIMLVGAIITALAVGVFAWVGSGAPTDITRIPFVRSWLEME